MTQRLHSPTIIQVSWVTKNILVGRASQYSESFLLWNIPVVSPFQYSDVKILVKNGLGVDFMQSWKVLDWVDLHFLRIATWFMYISPCFVYFLYILSFYFILYLFLCISIVFQICSLPLYSTFVCHILTIATCISAPNFASPIKSFWGWSGFWAELLGLMTLQWNIVWMGLNVIRQGCKGGRWVRGPSVKFFSSKTAEMCIGWKSKCLLVWN